MQKERNKADSYREKGFQPAIDYCKEHGYKWY